MNHTPGPWTFLDNNLLVAGKRQLHLGTFSESCGLGDAAEPNKALIAAAPELLDALLDLIPLIDIAFEYEGDVFGARHNHATDVVQLAVAIINKATGIKS